MKKILVVTFNYPPTVGGIETYAKELNDFFKEKSYFEIIHPKYQISNKKLLRTLSFLFFLFKCLSKIIFKKYDLIHFTNFNLWIIGFMYKIFHKNSKILINIWGLELVYTNKKGILPKIHNLIFVNKYIKNSDSYTFLVSSEASKNLMLRSGFRKEKINYISLGINIKNIINKKEINKTPEKYFLFVGRIIERKGLSWFAETILKEFNDYSLKVVGPIIDQLEFSKAISNKNIEYLGVVSEDELFNLRQNATAAVVPNIYLEDDNDFEAFCFVTIESIAAGTIIVASNYQGIADALQNGKIGFLPEPSNKESWISTLNDVVRMNEEEREIYIKEGINFLSDELSWDNLFQETEDLYFGLIKK